VATALGMGLTVTVAVVLGPVQVGVAAVVNTTSSMDIISELAPLGPPLVT
jgi:hypothetical protein